MNKNVIHTALIALGTFAVCFYVQKGLNFKIPVAGPYLPGGA
jgi:hypothetical protein